nr:Adaptor for signal transduction [Polyrhizophydium stewartii]
MDAWTADQVAAWMASLGLRGHEQVFRDNNITGDILVHADHEMLRELGIAAVGQRIALLKAIYNHKVQSGIPFEEDDYVPEAGLTPQLQGAQGQDIWLIKTIDGFHHHHVIHFRLVQIILVKIPRCGGRNSKRVYGLPGRETESYKSIRVHLNDTCAKLLPEVLAKYKLQDEDWRQYALFIQFRNAEGDETPEFSIRHIKQVNTPGVRISTLEPEALQAAPQGEGLAGHDAAAPSSATPNGKQDGFGDPANAVAIFEYTAQRADEFDVAIGDQFTIIARDTGWFVVEKAGRRGWVPAGCLLESRGSEGGQIDTQDLNQPGMALFDYEKNSPNELTIRKGDALVVHRKYQHWLLAECNGDQGWVPSYSAKKLGSSLALTDVREQPEREQGDASSRSLAQATAFGTSPSRDVGRAQSEKQATSKEAASSPASVATGLAGRAEPFGSAGQSEQATQKRGRASSETLRTASDRSPGGPASAAARQAAVGNTALSKLSSLLDTINPFMAETRSASPSAPAASSLYISQTPSASALAAYSAGPSAHSYSPLAGAGSGIAVSGPTPDLSGAERSSQLRSEDALAKPGNRDVAVLGQLLQQTDMLLAEFQGEISINVAGIPASGAKVERLVSVREMMNVLAARLGAHGTHTISPAAYTSVVRSLDALSENIGMRLTELRDHAVAHAAGGQSQDGLRGDAVFRRIAKERDDIIQDSIDHTYNSLTRIVGLLLEDARNTQRANSAAAQPLAASEAAAAGVVPNADGSGYGSPKSTPVGALQHQSSTQSLRAPPPDDKSASAGIGIGIGIGIGLGLGLGIGSVGGERSVELQRELQARMRSIQVARRAATPEPEIEVATPVSAAPSGSMSAGAFGGAMPWSSGASVVSSASLASAGSAAIQGGDGSGRAGTAAPGSPHPFANDDATQQQHQQQRFALLDPNEVFEELPYSVVIQRKDLNQNFLEVGCS